MLRRLHTVLCVAAAGCLLQLTLAVSNLAAAADAPKGPAVADGAAGAAVSEPSAAAAAPKEDPSATRAGEAAVAPMRQGAILMSLRSDDDESGVLAMLEEQQANIELALSAHFGSEEVRIVDITAAAPEDFGHSASDPELQLCRAVFEMAAPTALAASSGSEDGALLQFSLQQSLDEADARLAIEDLSVQWDEVSAAAEEGGADQPSTTLYV